MSPIHCAFQENMSSIIYPYVPINPIYFVICYSKI